MKVGIDYVFAKKSLSGYVTMYLDAECKNIFLNSLIYDNVCECMKNIGNGQVEMIMI